MSANIEISFVELMEKAKNNDVNAQYEVGDAYYNGEGVEKDYIEAVKWWRLAAEQGHEGAIYNLAVAYVCGYGVDMNYSEAFRLWRILAIKGDLDSQYAIGLCYNNGDGVEQNSDEAEKWFKCAADKGHNEAREAYYDLIKCRYIEVFELFNQGSVSDEAFEEYASGVSYIEGYDGEKNYEKAIGHFKAAAEKGHADAGFIMGVACEKGMEIEQNINEALKWYEFAADKGHSRAKEALERLTSCQK